MSTGILMDLDVGRIDHLEHASLAFTNMDAQQLAEDSAVRPAKMKPVDTVPLSISFWKLIPNAAGDENPPDAIQSFSNISRRTALFQNVRFFLPGVKLIFLGS